MTGTLTNSSGRKLSGICVLVASQEEAGGLGASPLGLLFGLPSFSAIGVSSNGSYRIVNLAPGSYEAEFFAGCGKSATTYAAQWFAP